MGSSAESSTAAQPTETGHLSTSEVARILGLREQRVREMARAGLVRPDRRGRRYAFSFQDLVVLRAARELYQNDVPPARVRRALATLSEQIGQERSLSGLRIFAQGRDVAVRSGEAAWHPETGQTLFDFDTGPLEERARDLAAARRERHRTGDARQRAQLEFARALDLEERDPAEAAQAYASALELDPQLVDAYVNLGRIAHESGNAAEAARLYELALELTPEDPIIHFNLGLALEDTQGLEAAARRYEQALALDPDFADAHFNLAGLLEKLGRSADALRHYRAYQKLTER